MPPVELLTFDHVIGVQNLVSDKLTNAIIYSRGGLLFGKTYILTACIINAAGDGVIDSELRISTSPNPTPPSAVPPPELIHFTGGSLTLGFQQPFDNGGSRIVSYELEMGRKKTFGNCDETKFELPLECFEPISPPATWVVDALSSSMPSIQIFELVANTDYYFRARANNGKTDPEEYSLVPSK